MVRVSETEDTKKEFSTAAMSIMANTQTEFNVKDKSLVVQPITTEPMSLEENQY